MRVPAGIADMAEVRRIYNENLKPNVDHMRAVFPVDVEETTIAGIPAAIVTPKGGVPERNKNRLFLNGPGGGFRTGVRGNGLLISIPVAAALGVKVVTITYRQGPIRFPAASEDLLKVWDRFTQTYKPQNIGLVGCSAGGSLVTHTTAMLIRQGKPTPGVLGVYCAGLGSPGSGDSRFPLSALSVTSAPRGLTQTGTPAPAQAGQARQPHRTVRRHQPERLHGQSDGQAAREVAAHDLLHRDARRGDERSALQLSQVDQGRRRRADHGVRRALSRLHDQPGLP